ncbi:MAG TPA: hypothetical protein VMT85_00630 [Thermoanaerobaculia bacterium]|nr:hypothetical protein [Thermoanaerobaculia bacterium]
MSRSQSERGATATVARKPPLTTSSTLAAPPCRLTIVVLTLVGLAVAACEPQPAEPAAPELPAPAPLSAVASVRQIMDAMVIPSSAAIWDVAREAPADDEAWSRLAHLAVQLAESGNLLLIGERAIDDEVWRQTAILLRDGGAQALAAIEARNVEGVVEAGNALIDSCEICHERHLAR